MIRSPTFLRVEIDIALDQAMSPGCTCFLQHHVPGQLFVLQTQNFKYFLVLITENKWAPSVVTHLEFLFSFFTHVHV